MQGYGAQTPASSFIRSSCSASHAIETHWQQQDLGTFHQALHLLYLLTYLKMQQLYLLKSCCCSEMQHGSIAHMGMPHEKHGCLLEAFEQGYTYKPRGASLMAA